MSPRAYDVITFDCYGTLIDWEDGIWSAFREAAARCGVTLDRDQTLARYAQIEALVEREAFRPYADVLCETARRVAERSGWSLDDGGARFLPESLPSWKPFPDTNAALSRLAAAGFRLGILSNVDDALLAETRKHFDATFDLIVTAQQVRSYKPSPAHWRVARQRIPSHVPWLHAAQSYFHDIIPARTFGLPTAWVNRTRSVPLDGGHAMIEVTTLAELATVLGA